MSASEPTKKCPFCAETIKAEAIVCRYCGRDLQGGAVEVSIPKPKQRGCLSGCLAGGFEFLWTLIISPVLIFLSLWKQGLWGKLALVAIVSFIIIGTIQKLDTEENVSVVTHPITKAAPHFQETPHAVQLQAPDTLLPTATNTLLPLAPAFEEIRNKMDAMTDAQWNEYSSTLKGMDVVNWSGWVEDVNKKFLGGYELLVDMDSPDEAISVQDITFDIPDNIALKLQKNSNVIFSGKIKSIHNILGSLQINLVDASVSVQ